MEEIKTTRDFVLWINSMTHTELKKEFPNRFHDISGNKDAGVISLNMLANDAIKCILIKEFAQKEITN